MRIALIVVLLGQMSAVVAAQEKLDFSRDVRPILSEHCVAADPGLDPGSR